MNIKDLTEPDFRTLTKLGIINPTINTFPWNGQRLLF